jgi:hypothetical protein
LSQLWGEQSNAKEDSRFTKPFKPKKPNEMDNLKSGDESPQSKISTKYSISLKFLILILGL